MEIKNQKLRAVVAVAGIVTSIAIGLTIIKLALTYIPLNVLATGGMSVLLVGALYMLYVISLEQIKRDDKIKELTKNYSIDQK